MSKPYFSPKLVNPPAKDPALYIEIAEHKRTILVDCGEIQSLTDQQLNKISDIFISHTHIDHFIGFDRIIRSLVRYRYERKLRICGPSNLAQQIQYKLLSYTWNLPFGHEIELVIDEIAEEGMLKVFRLSSKDHFKSLKLVSDTRYSGALDRGTFHVTVACLDHHITSLGYCFESPEQWLVKKESLASFPHKPGAWLKELTNLCRAGKTGGTLDVDGTTYKVEELIAKLLEKKATEKVGYVVDVQYNLSNKEKVIGLVKNANILFCESHFLHKDEERARETRHLTAKQAGEMARMAGVGKLKLLHFSPRYTHREHKQIIAEGVDEFNVEVKN